MAEQSRCSTRAIKADQAFCRQVARLLFADAEPIQKAFLGEPVRKVLALVDWALAHEDDPGFEAGRALEAWARRHCRGAYGPRDGMRDNTLTRQDISAPWRSDEVRRTILWASTRSRRRTSGSARRRRSSGCASLRRPTAPRGSGRFTL